MPTLGERLNGIRWRLTATKRLWSAAAEPAQPFLPPEPFDSLKAGQLDDPRPGATLVREPTAFRGWVLFPGAATSHVDIWLGETPVGRARLGIPRADIDGVSEDPRAALSGFDLPVDLSEWPGPDGPVTVRAVATSTSGERLELTPVEAWIGEGGPNPLRPRRKKTLPPPPAPTPQAPDRKGRRVLFFTHQLNVGGAQLYLLELIEELLRREAINPTVVSAGDGLLRERLEELGVPVHITGLAPLEDVNEHLGRIEELASWAAGRDFDLVFVNTSTVFAFPGAELAGRLGIPAIWSIHESFKPPVLWSNLDEGVRGLAEGALSEAALALFVAEPTQHLYEETIDPARCLTVPYGFDFSPIEEARASLDRGTVRRDKGIAEDAEVILCLGTVEPRKRQIPLAHAFETLAHRHPRARLAIVGLGDDEYTRRLEAWVAGVGLESRIDLVPITPEVQDWYCASDILVCASDVESLPRTVVEAMAWEMPVLATDVFGLPEVVIEGETGWLCETRDTGALAAGLERALSSTPEERKRIGAKARELVLKRHSLSEYGDRIAELLDEVATAKTNPTQG